MSKALYLDCFSGASGDMIVGALLDLGLPIEALRSALGSLAIEYGGVSSERVQRAGISAIKFHVTSAPGADGPSNGAAPAHGHDHGPDDGPDQNHAHGHGHHHAQREPQHHEHHSLKEIAGAIGRSALSAAAKQRAVHLFERLAAAEAAVHDMPIDKVHLHEVGALDSIIDIVGAVYGLEWMGAGTVLSSPLNVGSGTVQCAHGTFPVPAPATARLLAGVPIYAGPVAAEMVTPTGALIVTDYASGYGPLPVLRLDSTGYGAGSRDFTGHPNVLRVFLGELVAESAAGGDMASSSTAERIVTMACEIDDMNPQLYGPLMDRLAAVGALDVFYVPVQMKKNRPGTLVTVIAHPDRREAIAGVMFTETTTIGVRYQEMLRDRLDREVVAVETEVGPIRFKVASRDGRILNAAPEFDDCARLAEDREMPIKDVQALAVKAWLDTKRC